MKKTKIVISAVLAALMMLSLCACGEKKNEAAVPEISDSLELMETVWNAYSDNEKFPAVGGDYSEDNMKTDAPGKFGVEDKQSLSYLLCVPESGAALIDDAASLVHMMNTNTFTAGVFRCADSADTAELAKLIGTEIENRQWICGMPDKFVIYSVGNYVVSVFGADEIVDTFTAKLSAAYPTAEQISEQRIS